MFNISLLVICFLWNSSNDCHTERRKVSCEYLHKTFPNFTNRSITSYTTAFWFSGLVTKNYLIVWYFVVVVVEAVFVSFQNTFWLKFVFMKTSRVMFSFYPPYCFWRWKKTRHGTKKKNSAYISISSCYCTPKWGQIQVAIYNVQNLNSRQINDNFSTGIEFSANAPFESG